MDRAISSPVAQITCWSNVMLKSTDLDPHGQYKVGIRGVRVDKIGLGVLPGNRNYKLFSARRISLPLLSILKFHTELVLTCSNQNGNASLVAFHSVKSNEF